MGLEDFQKGKEKNSIELNNTIGAKGLDYAALIFIN